MRRQPILAVLAVSCGLSFPGAASAQSEEQDKAGVRAVLSAAVDDFIVPEYRALQEQARSLQEAVQSLCEDPGTAKLDQARQSFAEAVTVWSRVETVRFGPILRQNAAERIYFFPDRRGIGLRQVQGVLAEEDATATDAESLAGKSVALQGLGTLEFLLFGTGAEVLAEEEGDFRCRFAEAVAERIEVTAAEVTDEWTEPDGIAARFVDPASSYADFQTQEDSLRALLGVFTNGLEMIADTRIAPFLGEDVNSVRPKAAAWWRAGLTGPAILANLEGLSDLFQRSGMANLLPEENGNLPVEIAFEFDNAERALQKVETPLSEAVETAEGRSPLAYLLIVTRSLRSLFAERFSGAIGLVAGFSSLDGD
ncbi:imelysin family protein [Notoacmeibacter ruber]|uniref:Peptidase M75, Imelysin n=1 Tax=Notoacmeibacter ruber TaxID=2670375 RepID=A0A3L7J9X7_9HYPH|nr:imelysin family protein [Notoacmeibacter ruber]RLQ87224.1 peptidase M75, Imelysin [Notoacmeibacter ruber]